MIAEIEKIVSQYEEELKPLYQILVEKEYSSQIHQYEDKCYYIFSRNLTFLRSYLGFLEKYEAYNQIEFANLFSVSVTSLRRWETGVILPGKAYLKTILNYANKVLEIEPALTIADVLCKNIVPIITSNEVKTIVIEKPKIIDTSAFKIPNEISSLIDQLRDFVYDIENRNIFISRIYAVALLVFS